ncbi:glycosyltransferase [Comamonas testosteroni]|uniref:glycosyltransferase n=1 Tax=Comamonas testosteroni TaxID=285 RepID=UPI00076C7E2D|nr:glycosyltransferase [Comamonas testosteroni]KWT70390.1 glycosyl transferase [Comamonas testosteroni]
MSFSKANNLTRQGNYAEAERIYSELYSINPLDIYLDGLNFARSKQEKTTVASQYKKRKDGDIKRVLFVTAGLKGPTAGGGIATCFHSMIKTLGESQGSRVSVLYIAHPYYSKEGYDFWKKYYKEECNAEFLVTNINKKNYGSQEMQRSHAVLEYLVANSSSFDTIVFHDYMGLAYYSLLAQKNGMALCDKRIVISAHGNHTLSYHFGQKKIKTWNEKVTFFMERESLKMANEVTTPSEYYKGWFLSNFGVDNARVIPNIILHEEGGFSKTSIKFGFKKKDVPLVIFYGRMERLKGIDVFLDALKNSEEKFNVLFAGNSSKIDDVDSKKYIEEKLKDCAVDFRFEFNCKSEDIYHFANENNGLFVFPTLGETSSCVVVESILHGAKFLASDIPGIKELIKEEYHDNYLFESGSSSSLLAKLVKNIPSTSEDVLSFEMQENKKKWIAYLEAGGGPFDSSGINFGNDLISIVIPTADRPSLLEESLASIKEQNYKKTEIIVFDDASVEYKRNESIALKYGAKYFRSETKIYKGAACNQAVKHAKGKYVCFFDDDDIAKPDMLEMYARCYSLNPEIDVISGFADCFEHQDYVDSGLIRPGYTSLALGGGAEVNLSINFFGKGTFIVKKDKFLEIGGYEEDIDSVPMVDYRFYIKSALSKLKIRSIPAGVYFYRKNSPNSLFYINKDKKNLQFLAKKSIENIMKNKLGEDLGNSFAAIPWNISLPLYE